MKQLLLHSLLVAPVIHWIASPHRRWSKKTGIWLASIALLVIALLQLKRMDMNCFELIGVSRSATSAEISRAFRKQSAVFHPDRKSELQVPHGFENHQEVFIQLQKCHEVITDATKLNYYNRFGKLDFQWKNESTVLPIMAAFAFVGYLINFIVCTVFTSSADVKPSRLWICSFIFFAFSCEMYMKYLNTPSLFWFIPWFCDWMVFEQVDALSHLIPSVLSSGVLLSRILHVDETGLINQVLDSVAESNSEISSYILAKRQSTVGAPPVPAVIKLMSPRRPAPASPPPPPTGGLDQGQPQQAQVKQEGGWSFQKIFGWLFYAYVAKVVFNGVRQLI